MANSSHLNEIKKCVTFIFIEQNGQLVPNGTGFFVGVENEENSNLHMVYLVTAKHVLQNQEGALLSSVVIRLNTSDGNSKMIKAEFTKKNKVFTHPDSDVDLALFRCLPDPSVYDFKMIRTEEISDKQTIDKHEISEGDEVFFAGLFTSHVGQKKNQPIIRFGRVALMSDEKVEWKEKGKPQKLLDLYLLECQSYGGNSGSPVFFQLSPIRKPGQINFGGPMIFLAGVMSGSFLSGSELQVTETKQNIFSLQNIGIAAVTPGYKLKELLFSEELVKSRKDKS